MALETDFSQLFKADAHTGHNNEPTKTSTLASTIFIKEGANELPLSVKRRTHKHLTPLESRAFVVKKKIGTSGVMFIIKTRKMHVG